MFGQVRRQTRKVLGDSECVKNAANGIIRDLRFNNTPVSTCCLNYEMPEI